MDHLDDDYRDVSIDDYEGAEGAEPTYQPQPTPAHARKPKRWKQVLWSLLLISVIFFTGWFTGRSYESHKLCTMKVSAYARVFSGTDTSVINFNQEVNGENSWDIITFLHFMDEEYPTDIKSLANVSYFPATIEVWAKFETDKYYIGFFRSPGGFNCIVADPKVPTS